VAPASIELGQQLPGMEAAPLELAGKARRGVEIGPVAERRVISEGAVVEAVSGEPGGVSPGSGRSASMVGASGMPSPSTPAAHGTAAGAGAGPVAEQGHHIAVAPGVTGGGDQGGVVGQSQVSPEPHHGMGHPTERTDRASAAGLGDCFAGQRPSAAPTTSTAGAVSASRGRSGMR
jgi:hypothetical protein